MNNKGPCESIEMKNKLNMRGNESRIGQSIRQRRRNNETNNSNNNNDYNIYVL